MKHPRDSLSSRVGLLPTVAAVLLVAAAPVGADWPMYGHDEARSGVADGAGPSKLEVQWAVELGGRVDSSPAVGPDGTVYIGTDDGRLLALWPDGTFRWAVLTGGPVVYVRLIY